MRVLAVNHVSLDGVLQGPGRPDEDTRNGFLHDCHGGGDDDIPARLAAFLPVTSAPYSL